MKCFACDKKMKNRKYLIRCEDEQTAFVGPECYKYVEKSGECGYQPPLGGPRLFVISDQQFEGADD
jgi:hypothetical protein